MQAPKKATNRLTPQAEKFVKKVLDVDITMWYKLYYNVVHLSTECSFFWKTGCAGDVMKMTTDRKNYPFVEDGKIGE